MPYEVNPQAEPGLSMPFSMEAEQSVLGAILLEPSCLDTVAEILPRAEYFYAVNNQMIYSVMLEMLTLSLPVDFITVLEKLKENEEFDEATGKVYLTQLAQLVPSIGNVAAYANIVRNKYDVRTLMQAARGILDDANEGAEDSALILDRAEQRIYDIRRGKNRDGLKPVNEILLETFERLDLLNSPDREMYRGIPTGNGAHEVGNADIHRTGSHTARVFAVETTRRLEHRLLAIVAVAHLLEICCTYLRILLPYRYARYLICHFLLPVLFLPFLSLLLFSTAFFQQPFQQQPF